MHECVARTFTSDEGSDVPAADALAPAMFLRVIDGPETVQFSYSVKTAEAIGDLYTSGGVVGESGDPFIAGDTVGVVYRYVR